MHSFLRNTAASILSEYQELHNLVIVLPNRRAGLFFTQHLGALIQKPTWMPEVHTIEDVFYQFAEQSPTDDLTLIFELYKVYQTLHSDSEAFDKFYFWGEMILKDFNDIDQFMADAEKLYLHLSEIKELESDLSFLSKSQIDLIHQFWNSFFKQTSTHKEKFLKFWQLLSPLYRGFQASLEVSGMAYSGKLYRKVATSVGQIPKPEKQYVFIGFNAFTKTEEMLLKHFISEFGAKIFWDIDAYYLNDKNQEAGLFFREYRKDKVFGPTFPLEIPSLIQGRQAKIHTYATPLKTNQANLVGAILEKIDTDENREETVVILPDEQLLFPVLHTLPSNIQKVNVTMGYPVKNAPVYAFLEAVLELQRYIKEVDGKVLFYHQAVKNLISSVYFKKDYPNFVKEILGEMKEKNQIYLTEERLHEGGVFFQLVFRKLKGETLFPYLSTLIEKLADRLESDELQRAYLFQCFKQLNRLREIFEGQSTAKVDLEFFIGIFRQVFREIKLPFEGEPLQGLQVMGVLESRNLDFRRVIICNLNENSFPPAGGLNSMIPFNIRKAFGLPVQEQNDAIYAYTFYRLLHSAEEVHMIYTTASDQGKAGEKSRYIQQMMVEMGLEIEEEVIYVPIDLKPTAPIEIEKTPEVLQLLDKYVMQGGDKAITSFSPSALNVYLDCRFKFYLQYLANIQEKAEVKEEIDAAVFGSIAHYSIEFLYLGFLERKKRDRLEKEDFADLKKNWVFHSIELGVRKFYHLEENADTKLSGQMAIVRDVMQKYLIQLLEIDEEDAPFRLVSMEKAHQAGIEINTSNGMETISLKGYIDRVDDKDGTIRLIDYKSGSDKKDFPTIQSLFDREKKSRNKAAMQTMFYGLLYQASHPDNSQPLRPAIINFKEIFKQDFNPYLIQKEPKMPVKEVLDYRDFQSEYVQHLRSLLEEMYNPEVPFSQTDDEQKCKYCPYAEICGR